MAAYEEFPVTINETTKRLDIPEEFLTDARAAELEQVNQLARELVALNADVPMPPNQINGKLTEQVRKMRESGNLSFKKAQYVDALRLYSLAIEMATKRSPWEASQYVREETAVLFSNRAQAYMASERWEDGLADADMAIYLRRNQAKPYWRKGKCLQRLGRLAEARETFELGLEFEPGEADLQTALAAVIKELEAAD
ncbi:uncharacterized protein V1510DRAFT_410875 [Dipodascopsis tothii]|uniref:uncharacterized protein n=1 Tax=Dipodascopsis tothii TaxID=44089 RepID=UPI0034CF7BA7